MLLQQIRQLALGQGGTRVLAKGLLTLNDLLISQGKQITALEKKIAALEKKAR